jgi:transposase
MANRTGVVIGGSTATTPPSSTSTAGCWPTPSSAPTPDGDCQLLGWLRRHGQLAAVGVEGTGTSGAGLTRFLLEGGVQVLEADRPDRSTRRRRGKSDPVDAGAAARGGWPAPRPRCPSGATGWWRRSGCCVVWGLARSRRAPRRSSSRPRWYRPGPPCASRWTDGQRCGRWRPDLGSWPTRSRRQGGAAGGGGAHPGLEQPTSGWVGWSKAAPRTLGCWRSVSSTPGSCGQPPATPPAAAWRGRVRPLVRGGADPGLQRTNPAARLHRGGGRDANRALHLAVVVRMRCCPRTPRLPPAPHQAGAVQPEIMRCVKRYLAREVDHAILADFQALHAT